MSERDLDVGHTVINGRLAHLSVSSCEKASPRHMGCYRRWNYDKVQGDKEPEKNASKVAKQKGTDMHDRLAHYLRTGENILKAPEAAGKHMLPEPGPDLWIEQAFHRVEKYDEQQPDGSWKFGLTRLTSSLYAAGIPFVGYIDFAHGRLKTWTEDDGYIIDPVGTIEVGDHKFKSNAKDRNGNSNYLQPGELVQTIQMAGYGVVVANTQKHAERARLSHLVYPEKGDKPRKITRLHVLEDCLRTWEYVNGVARTLIEVAKETDVNKVDGHVQSCDAYGGCPYRSKCTKYGSTSTDNLFNKVASDFKKETNKDTAMGLIADNPQLMQQNPQQNTYAPQAPQPDHRAQLAAEEAQMRAQQVQQQAQVAAPPPSLLAAAAKLQGMGRGMPKLIGAAAMAYAAAGGQSIAPGSEYPGFGEWAPITLSDPQHIFAFLADVERQMAPPAPQPTFTQQLAQAYNAQVPPAQQVQYPQGAVVGVATTGIAMQPQAMYTQPITAPLMAPNAPESQPQLAQQQPNPPVATAAAPAPGSHAPGAGAVGEAEAPKKGRGRPKKSDSGTTPEPTAAAQASTPSSPVQATQVAPAAVSTSPKAGEEDQYGVTPYAGMILVNARTETVQTKSLAGYVDYINEKLARMYNTTKDGKQGPLDCRTAVEGSLLGYGGWKGAVRTAVLADPPPPGVYHFDTYMSELNEVVADGLRALEAKGWLYVRGVR